MKLESGKEVTLKPLTIIQRIECQDTMSYTKVDGGIEISNMNMANHKLAMYGLGLKSLEKLAGYTPDEVIEIANAVQEADQKGANPTPKG